jgi:hypothetical protein
MFLYVFTAEILIPHQTNKLNNSLPLAFGFLCFTILGMVLFFRAKKMRPAFNTLQLKPDDPVALQQWRTGAIITAVLLEAIVLDGFALRFLGASPKVSVPFYIVGIGLMLSWWPQRP